MVLKFTALTVTDISCQIVFFYQFGFVVCNTVFHYATPALPVSSQVLKLFRIYTAALQYVLDVVHVAFLGPAHRASTCSQFGIKDLFGNSLRLHPLHMTHSAEGFSARMLCKCEEQHREKISLLKILKLSSNP